jgi:xanthine dehydrogenase YagR molybdenum-binding subunit
MPPADGNGGYAAIGKPELRIDGRLKVTGAARYPADEPLTNPAFAFLVTSAISRGRVTGFDLAEAKAVPGVLDIMTHENVGDQVKSPPGPSGPEATTTLESDRIWHDGQIIAIVLADTFEAAREAAFKVKPQYAPEPPTATFGSRGVELEDPSQRDKMHEHPKVGDAPAAFAAAPVKIDAHYRTPTQHHNPLELFTTTCFWTDGKLTIYEPSQFVRGLRTTVAKQLGLKPDDVRVVSKFIGGAFGSKGGATSRTAWIALASKRLGGRPVKLVPTRDQSYTIATYRAETEHHVRLAAERSGKLQAVIHEGTELSSRPSPYNVSGNETTALLYASPNIFTRTTVVHADRNTPGFMRAPPETPYMFAFESAMDELAYALNMDPIELRRVNDNQVDPVNGQRFTSRHLMTCFDQAAEKFGWQARNPQPGSMRDGDWLIGYGCAAAAYTSNIAAAAARVSITPQGRARVQLAAQDIGTGAYTVLAITAADKLGLKVDDVTVEIGDSNLPPAGLAAGSNHTATICNVVAMACEQIRARAADAATIAGNSPLHGRPPADLKLTRGQLVAPDGTAEPLEAALGRIGGGMVEAYAENLPPGAPPDGLQKIHQDQMVMARGSKRPDGVCYAFGAQFVEVRVHSRTKEVRAPRAVGAFAAGTIVNPHTAHSQYQGGMIWGISAALHEETEIDQRAARYINDNISEYLIPVNADIGEVDVIFVPEEDHIVNPLGIKGIGEIGIVGMNAAVANAVYHATGKRIRDLPVRIEKLLET